VCPVSYFKQDSWLCYDRLGLNRNYELFAQIDEEKSRMPAIEAVCDPKDIPQGKRVHWYGDDGLKTITEDPYGCGLTYVDAREFANVEPGETGDWNKAVLAFLKALPPETPIVLWWH